MSDEGISINTGGKEVNAAGGRRAGIGAPARRQSSKQRVASIQAQQRQIIARNPKLQALRARMDDRNADKYYDSKQVSAIGDQSVSDTTLKRGEPVKPPKFRTALAQLDERNTDRYYRDALVRAPTKQQIEQSMKRNERQEQQPRRRAPQPQPHRRGPQGPQLPPQGTTLTPVHHSQSRHPLIVATSNQVREQARTAVALLHQGHSRVVIRITGKPILGMQVRTILDGMVGREELTEDQYRDIHIDLAHVNTADVVEETRTPDEVFGKPEDALKEKKAAGETKKVEEEQFDPEAFLSGDGDELDDLDGIPPEAAAVEVADTEAVEDDADNDFLSGDEGTVHPATEDDFLGGDPAPANSLFGQDKADPATPPPAAPPAPKPPVNNPQHHQGKKKKRR